jgi:multidrug efflux pump subunit AcrA (membrane-fusion protein)
MTCIATVITPESDSRAVTLPLTAIYAPAEGGDYVWIVNGEQRVERREAVLGELIGSSSVVVLSGVEAGDRVVAAGVYHLSEGERVRVIE